MTLSRIPPMLMLSVIVGLTITVSCMAVMLNADKKLIESLKASNAARSRIVFTLKDIPEGTKISSSDVQEREVETSRVPDDAFTSTEIVVGRTAKYGIPAGQMLSQHCIAANDRLEQPYLQEGMRAVSFDVATNAGVSGFVVPGSRVDVLAIVGSRAGVKAQPILSDVEVLRVGKNNDKQVGPRSPRPATSFTVAVTPIDATELAKAVTVGKLYLTARSDLDHTPVATVDIDSLCAENLLSSHSERPVQQKISITRKEHRKVNPG